MSAYTVHLSKDKQLKKLIDKHGPVKLVLRKDLAQYLYHSIISQQLSGKVATVIHNRFLDLFPQRDPLEQLVIDMPVEQLRGIGLSQSKASYVKNVAQFSLEHGIEFKRLQKWDDEEVIQYVTRIKGVGRWTAEMMLMFAMGREDVFALDDLGIQTAMQQLYKWTPESKKDLQQKMSSHAEKWRPYRTYACLHLWRWKDI